MAKATRVTTLATANTVLMVARNTAIGYRRAWRTATRGGPLVDSDEASAPDTIPAAHSGPRRGDDNSIPRARRRVAARTDTPRIAVRARSGTRTNTVDPSGIPTRDPRTRRLATGRSITPRPSTVCTALVTRPNHTAMITASRVSMARAMSGTPSRAKPKPAVY